jgi:hypothetical protein
VIARKDAWAVWVKLGTTCHSSSAARPGPATCWRWAGRAGCRPQEPKASPCAEYHIWRRQEAVPQGHVLVSSPGSVPSPQATATFRARSMMGKLAEALQPAECSAARHGRPGRVHWASSGRRRPLAPAWLDEAGLESCLLGLFVGLTAVTGPWLGREWQKRRQLRESATSRHRLS